MSDTLDPKTFDLIGFLSGRDYPEIEVKTYFNEVLGFEIEQLRLKIISAEARNDTPEIERLEREMEKKVAEAKSEEVAITIKSIPESVRRSLISQAQEKFPEKTDLLGRPQPNPAADEFFAKKMWAAYIRTVKGPDGSVKVVDEADVNAMYANAPLPAHNAINEGIKQLQTGATSGFEHLAKEADFLSQASPEG